MASQMRPRFSGQVAIVTGAGHGMGRAVACGLAREGAHVVVSDIEPDSGKDAAFDISRDGGTARFIRTDVGEPHQVESLFNEALEVFGGVDILVNNAGFTLAKPLIDYSVADWRRQMATNLDGVFFCTQAAARIMIPKRRGKIVNFASTAAFVSTAMPAAAYCASKAGVRQLTVATAAELGPHGINVNAVAPGTIITDMSRTSLNTPEKMARELVRIPLGRVGTSKDLVGPVLFLCSADSDYITGHVLVADGGWLLY